MAQYSKAQAADTIDTTQMVYQFDDANNALYVYNIAAGIGARFSFKSDGVYDEDGAKVSGWDNTDNASLVALVRNKLLVALLVHKGYSAV